MPVAGELRKKRATCRPRHLRFLKNASGCGQDLSNIRSLVFKITLLAAAISALRTADRAPRKAGVLLLISD